MYETYGRTDMNVHDQILFITGDEKAADKFGGYYVEYRREWNDPDPGSFGKSMQSAIRRYTGKNIRGIVYPWGEIAVLAFNFGDALIFRMAENLPSHATPDYVRERFVEVYDDIADAQLNRFDTVTQMEMLDAETENMPWTRCKADGCIYIPYKKKGKNVYNLVRIDEDEPVDSMPTFVLPTNLRLDHEPDVPDDEGIFTFYVGGQRFWGIVNVPGYNVPAFWNDVEGQWFEFRLFNDYLKTISKRVAENVIPINRKMISESFSPEMSAAEFVSDESNRNVFVCAHKYSVEGIFQNGFSRQFANANDFRQNGGALTYGDGQYGTPELANAANNLSRKPGDKPDGLKYGNVILKCVLIDGFNRFLILDEPMAKRVYGEKWRIFDQIDLLVTDPKDNQELKNFARPYESLSYYPDKSGRTNHIIFHMFDGGMPMNVRMASISKWTEFFRRNNIRGAVYRGAGDGFCFVCYNFSEVVPISASFDYGKTWTSNLFDWERTRNRLSFDNDITQKVGHKFKRVSLFSQKVQCNGKVFGLTLVETKNGKFNLVLSQTGEKLSSVDFDSEPVVNQETGEIEFEYKGKTFYGTVSLEGYDVPAFWSNKYEMWFTFDKLKEVEY
jgi:hypothetical protein